MSEPNTGDIFSSLLSNPAMLANVAKLISGMQSTSESAGSGSVGNSSEAGVDMSGMISAALSNPQLLAALPSLLGALSSAMPSTNSDSSATQPNDKPGDARAAMGEPEASGVSGIGGGGGAGGIFPALLSGGGGYKKPPKVTDRRSALLLALKPYMSHDKAEMIDTIVRIIEIMSLVK